MIEVIEVTEVVIEVATEEDPTPADSMLVRIYILECRVPLIISWLL